jgi:hypothetical protein
MRHLSVDNRRAMSIIPQGYEGVIWPPLAAAPVSIYTLFVRLARPQDECVEGQTLVATRHQSGGPVGKPGAPNHFRETQFAARFDSPRSLIRPKSDSPEV